MNQRFIIVEIVSVIVIMVTPAHINLFVQSNKGIQFCTVFCGIAALSGLADGNEIVPLQAAAVQPLHQTGAHISPPYKQHRFRDQSLLCCFHIRLNKMLIVSTGRAGIRVHFIDILRLRRLKVRLAYLP